MKKYQVITSQMWYVLKMRLPEIDAGEENESYIGTLMLEEAINFWGMVEISISRGYFGKI